MTTPVALERLLLQDGVPRLHTATRPPQLNPTVTGPQSRCDPCNSTSNDDSETDFEMVEATPELDGSENNQSANNPSILSNNDDNENLDPYLLCTLSLMEEQDDEDESFLLVVLYRRDGQPGLSPLLGGDQIYSWMPATPDPYDYASQDDIHTEHSDSEPSSRVNSAILNPFNFAAHRNDPGVNMMWSMFMSTSSTRSSHMNCSGRSESGSIYARFAETHLDDVMDGRMERCPEVMEVI
ncbi:predicted protein [Histoplasma capsulatum G186AR]|uniref:Uncharacterized protein n=2 Tax=Ajellomyces capsulatus TaxID=5037 RepID=C0NKM4_AJECG|nr:uncharacterized protein HCBG_03704 [Histoplasma capsulatum G186AR]EEH08415.1 predicted protein [Histoplasma capsulatum G186AR]KAG5299277.1 hypothetical protein I7I52_09533 [Histoplasma capsulatum]QSS68103.1 hypothetical protein I7I50_07395 [Histoplasma capsulatum G186AR]